MKSYKWNYSLVGLFVAAMITALIASLIWISDRTGPTDSYVITFDNVSEIKVGTVISYQGYPVGQVAVITPMIENSAYQFHLTADIKKGWKIPVDSVARIASSGVLSGKRVDISAGRSPQFLSPGSMVRSGASADIFAAFNRIAGDIGDLKDNALVPLVSKIGMAVDKLSGETSENLAELFGSLNSIAGEIDKQTPQIIGDVSSVTGKVNNQLLSAENIGDVQKILEQINQASLGADQAIADVKSASQQLNNLTKKVQEIVEKNSGNVDRSVANLEYILRTVSANIDTISSNLEGTSRNMNEFSRLIRQNPGLLLSGGQPKSDQGLE